MWRFEQRTSFYWFIEDHTACQEVLRISLALNEPKKVALRSNLNTTYEHAPELERKEIVD